MKVSLPFTSLILALLAWGPAAAHAESRMQVAVPSSPVMNQASAQAQSIGTVASGEILFVTRVEGDWAAVSPPERFTLWLNKDFIEGNRVVAKVIQVRSGPGIEHPVVGTLKRGAPVMPRGEEGDWCKIAPPSSCILWVNRKDLTEIKTHTTPIREVEAVAEPAKPAPKPQPTAPTVKPAPAPVVKSVSKSNAPKPVAKPAAKPADPPPPLSTRPIRIAPSKPQAATTPPPVRQTRVRTPATTTARAPASAMQAPLITPTRKKTSTKTSSKKTASSSKTSTKTPTSSKPTLRPATALPVQSTPPPPRKQVRKRRPVTAQPAPPPKKRVRKRKIQAKTRPVPAPAKTVAKAKKQKLEVDVDPALVEDLDLADLPNQGKSVQVEGEVRNAPFLAASPSRYRLLDYDDRILEMVCHLHGDSTVLRQFVGKGVSIRGREYWVESSDMPVIVVGEIIPLAPSTAAEEPVLF